MGEKTKKLILIDGNAIMHRAYHALPPLITKKGELVNAVYGFTSTLLSVIDRFKPDYIAASFDLPGPTFRHKEFEQYKATRVKAPDEFYVQIPRVKEIVQAFNIPIYEKESFEADDVIGTLVEQSESNIENIENIIVTGDLDTLQLVSPKTKVYTMRRGLSDSVLYDEEKVKERYELKPEQLTDFKGLRGDPSDNIPGVKGIGEKTAIELLKKYKTIENIYQHIEELKGAVKDKLERDKTQAILSKKLATIATDSPVGLEIEKAEVSDFDREKVVSLFNELNFYSLIKRLPQAGEEVHSVKSPASGGSAAKLQFNGVKDFKYEYIEEDKIDEFLGFLKDQPEISLAIETDSDSKLSALAFSWKAGRAGYIAEGEIKNKKLKIKNFLKDESIKKIGYDLKFIYKALKTSDINLKGLDFDVMLAAYLLDPGSAIKLEKIIFQELGEEMSFEEKTKGQLVIDMGESQEKKIKTLCQKADYSLKLKQILAEKLDRISEEQKSAILTKGTLREVFEKIEMPLVQILAQMELAGVKISTLFLKGVAEKIKEKIGILEKNIYTLAGVEFNINSTQQLASVLFEKLKLSAEDIKKTKTGFSTASSELNKLRGKHNIIEKIEEYRELFKLKTTYLDPLPKLVDENFRIHTNFNQAVTATGRLSSSEPNMQNIPIRTELGQLLRTAFVAEDGYRLVSADYSQIDLRAVAHVSNDKKLIEAFQRGDDIHKITASKVYKIPVSQVTETMRRSAKALNFGVIYGMSVFGFSAAAGVERDEAMKFINKYMEEFSGVADYIRHTKEFVREHGYVETIFGRRRNIPEINSPNFQVANAAERMAINMPIQGLAADIVKLAMIKIYEELIVNRADDACPVKSAEGGPDKQEFNGVKMVLQIHDEIILEVKENLAGEIAARAKVIMENVYKLKVPLLVNVKIGDSWGEI